MLFSGIGLRHRRLELGDIEMKRRIRAPLQGLGIGVHELVGLGQCLLQVMQELAQVGARL
jgi:hypothetical protein